MASTYKPAEGNEVWPDSAYPLVNDQPNPVAARKAWRSFNALLDYRAQYQGDRPFICPLDIDRGTYEVFTFQQVQEFVVSCAKTHAEILLPRQLDGKHHVIGMIGDSCMDYWINDVALQRLYDHGHSTTYSFTIE